MLVKAAESQWLGLDGLGNVNYETEPIPMGDADRITIVLVIHKMSGGTTQNDRRLLCQPELSNDLGSDGWVKPAGTEIDTNTTGTTQSVSVVNGAYLRFHFDFEITAGAAPGGVLYECIVLIDHA